MPMKLVGQELRYKGKKYILMKTEIDFEKSYVEVPETANLVLNEAFFFNFYYEQATSKIRVTRPRPTKPKSRRRIIKKREKTRRVRRLRRK